MAREYIRFEMVDMNGKAVSKTVPSRHRNGPVYMYSGICALGANAEVMTFPMEVAETGCPNYKLLPDWSSEQYLPWANRPGAIVRRVYCEQLLPDGKKCQAVPRTVCSKMMDELRSFKSLGLEMLIGGELEFTVAKPDGKDGWVPLYQGQDIYATLQNSKVMDFMYEVERNMEPVGVDILTINAECGAGQCEVAFVPKFGLEACDMTSTFRTGIKEMAQSAGNCVSFSARPFGVRGVGNGGHFNFSLWLPDRAVESSTDALSKVTRGKGNAFHGAGDPHGLSPTAKCFLAGVLAHAPALEAICSPTAPCYTRHGNWAPICANWGPEDRMACVRVKKAERPDKPSGCYFELRMPSAAANVYLVTAATIAAGLDGLERNLELPPPRQTIEQGAQVLPTSLGDSLKALECDAYMVEKLGAPFVQWFTGLKRAEDKFMEDKLATGTRSDADVSAVWQHMFFQYI